MPRLNPSLKTSSVVRKPPLCGRTHSFMTAEALNDIFAPDEKENVMLLRSMWTASCIFRLAPFPSLSQVSLALHFAPEEAVRRVFDWTDDAEEAHRIAQSFDEVAIEVFERETDGGSLTALPGSIELLADLAEGEIPSSVLSNLPLEVIEKVLERIGIKDLVECIETYDDRLKTEAQLLLNACLEMERPPRHACFFDFSARGIDTAHDNDMRCVALDGLYYQELEINQCDAKLNQLTDWTLPRFRQLLERYPFDEQFLTITSRAASRAPVKRKTAVEFRYEKGKDGKLSPTSAYLATEQKRVEQRERRLRRGRGPPEEGASKFLSRGGTGGGREGAEEEEG
ncbi:hypothetical protein NSK_007986 [Nannochloropsis salina CCMP1776]|uniref:F-box domain-containing protein n=1 Tax=Nannochloropsis salina CCMP1776 TaxID=1027361 RepID=A0A4D9CVW5_9STRA|nr:hypothetical protein NSK_007986 [Nannochloropsis salina CCMP1776]|eukprot:TFJ80809.1 hypothetical protein NSK_007986 [Nannochloropsis salina CCMP1776]